MSCNRRQQPCFGWGSCDEPSIKIRIYKLCGQSPECLCICCLLDWTNRLRLISNRYRYSSTRNTMSKKVCLEWVESIMDAGHSSSGRPSLRDVHHSMDPKICLWIVDNMCVSIFSNFIRYLHQNLAWKGNITSRLL